MPPWPQSYPLGQRDRAGVAFGLTGLWGRPLAAAWRSLASCGGQDEGIFGKSLRGLRRARHAWVLSPSSGPASPRAAASTRSVSVSGVLAATSVLLPRTAIHTLSTGSNRM